MSTKPTVNVRLTPSERKDLDYAMDVLGLSVSGVVRTGIAEMAAEADRLTGVRAQRQGVMAAREADDG